MDQIHQTTCPQPWGGDFNLMKVLEQCSKDLDAIPGA